MPRKVTTNVGVPSRPSGPRPKAQGPAPAPTPEAYPTAAKVDSSAKMAQARRGVW